MTRKDELYLLSVQKEIEQEYGLKAAKLHTKISEHFSKLTGLLSKYQKLTSDARTMAWYKGIIKILLGHATPDGRKSILKYVLKSTKLDEETRERITTQLSEIEKGQSKLSKIIFETGNKIADYGKEYEVSDKEVAQNVIRVLQTIFEISK